VQIMDDRRRLLERVYSREGAAEEPQDHRDPLTGAVVRMTPSEWALAEYDRTHAVSSTGSSTPGSTMPGAKLKASDGALVGAASGALPRADTGAGRGDGDGYGRADAEEDAGTDEGGTDGGRRHPTRLGRAAPVLVAAGAFVLGVLVAIGISTAVGRGGPAPSTPAAAVSTSTDLSDEGFHPLPGPAIEEFFRTAPRVDDLPADVTSGFVPTSFHELASSVTMQQSARIYAAKRLDDEYCLVAVAGASRVAETCATVEGIATHGLTLAKDAVRDVDGRPLTVTVRWETDGTISWEAMPSAG
jgi:hypothetical protein